MAMQLLPDRERIEFELPAELRAEVIRLARENERSVSAEVRLALRRHIERERARIERERAHEEALTQA
jgi:Arc/MetJ family transcription regulator